MDYQINTLSQLKATLVAARKRLQLRQIDVAERMGITQQSYAKLEANPASASLERLYSVLQILQVDLVLRIASEGGPSTPTESTSAATKQEAW
ncbi:helix-turn-helix domain-containing protein [Chitinimonas taiwanensis]|uniref:HTH-type transcriptional regulator / antitoxin HipB n=1 Tax=Chitinimonas taiwanensis DSM 18899 TaxID=1121279 RepID=A0A1K2HS34_9NEIS|nr:helix-turn-helix transcriptional regulator [Chitinimonas taiwanensis]SFZ79558.1 HTH-type transcriptional regulator / antitoxin HipB [Chitinimonas taiwanensis DSM 18899]